MEWPAPSTSHQIAATRLTPRGETGPTICFAAFAGSALALGSDDEFDRHRGRRELLIGWQVHQVEELCKKMLPGTPVAKIRPAIEKHGLWNGLVAYQFDHEGGRGYYREQTKTWDYGVPPPMTLGDTECFTSHDGSVVVHKDSELISSFSPRRAFDFGFRTYSRRSTVFCGSWLGPPNPSQLDKEMS